MDGVKTDRFNSGDPYARHDYFLRRITHKMQDKSYSKYLEDIKMQMNSSLWHMLGKTLWQQGKQVLKNDAYKLLNISSDYMANKKGVLRSL